MTAEGWSRIGFELLLGWETDLAQQPGCLVSGQGSHMACSLVASGLCLSLGLLKPNQTLPRCFLQFVSCSRLAWVMTAASTSTGLRNISKGMADEADADNRREDAPAGALGIMWVGDVDECLATTGKNCHVVALFAMLLRGSVSWMRNCNNSPDRGGLWSRSRIQGRQTALGSNESTP